MNNNPVDNQPVVPPTVPNWVFYMHIHGCAREFGANNDIRLVHQLARRTLLSQLRLMSHT